MRVEGLGLRFRPVDTAENMGHSAARDLLLRVKEGGEKGRGPGWARRVVMG